MMNNYAPLQGVAENLAQHGRYGDSMLVHMNPIELQGIAALSPTGQLTINPVTGQQEAFLPFLAPLLGSMLGTAALSSLPAWAAGAIGSGLATWATTGSFKKGLTSGIMGAGLGKMFGAGADVTKGAGEGIAGLGGGTTFTSTGIADPTKAVAAATAKAAATAPSTFGQRLAAPFTTEGFKAMGTEALKSGTLLPMQIGSAGLAQIDFNESMEQLAQQSDTGDEEDAMRAKRLLREGLEQSYIDYPQKSYRKYDRGGIVSINPANYARRRNGFNALAGNPVRMQTGGTAALRQARLRGPKVITPEELAAAGRPGFGPEITYFKPSRVGVDPETGPITSPGFPGPITSPGFPGLPTLPDYFMPPVQGGNLGYGYDQSLGFGEGGAQFEPIDPYYGLGRGVNYGGSYDSSAGGSSDIYDGYLPKSPSAQNQAATLISEDYPDIINNQAASDAINSATDYVSGTPASQSATQQLAPAGGAPAGGPPIAPAGGPPISPAGGALDFMGGFEPTDPYGGYGGYGVPAQPVAQAPAGRPPVPSAGLEPTDPYYGGGYGGNYGYDRFNEGGITDIPPELADEQAVMASADMLPAEAPIENEVANQLIEQTMMAVLGELPSEQAEIVIARFIDEFGEEAFQMLREQALQMAVPGAQTQGMLEGPGGGMDDQIPGMIGNQQPVAVSPGEFIVPADVVSGLGDGSSDAGAVKLDNMMSDVRMAKTGGIMQPRRISNAVLPV